MRNERGIRLFALVVTIVVLLILAGVTITYALGDNGIFGTAKKAELGSIKAAPRISACRQHRTTRPSKRTYWSLIRI